MTYSPRTNYVRRVQRETFVLGFGVGWLVLIAAMVASHWMSIRSPLSLPIMISGAVASVVLTFGLMAYRLTQGRAKLEACNWRRCCWCEYDTTPTGESGMCPECGREFSSALLKADYQGLMEQIGWWLPKRWRTISSGDAAGNATIDHAPLRAPKPGAKDYVERSTRRGNLAQALGMIAGWFLLGFVGRALHLKVSQGYQFFAVIAFCAGVGVLFRMAYMLYRRARLSRRDWNICPWCERDTRDIGPVGTCPSCGGEFSAPDLKADFDAVCRYSAWMFWLRPDGGLRDSDKSPTQ